MLHSWLLCIVDYLLCSIVPSKVWNLNHISQVINSYCSSCLFVILIFLVAFLLRTLTYCKTCLLSIFLPLTTPHHNNISLILNSRRFWNVVSILNCHFNQRSSFGVLPFISSWNLKRHGLTIGDCFFALFEWKIVLVISNNVYLLVKFGITFPRFGKFCHIVTSHQDSGFCTSHIVTNRGTIVVFFIHIYEYNCVFTLV